MTQPLPPGSVVGVLGGGQLARMLALAAAPMGLRVHVLAPEPPGEAPAAPVVELYTQAGWEDGAALEAWGRGVDVVTCEFENVPAHALQRLAAVVPVHPGACSFAVAQDRAAEKRFARRQGGQTGGWCEVDGPADLEAAVARLGLPLRLKTRRLGYDGRGQARARAPEEARAALAALGGRGLIAEREIGFESEFSILCARGIDGALAFWPPVANVHEGGILRTSVAPAGGLGPAGPEARALAGRLAHALGHVGVLAVEYFLSGGRALFSEMAPRVHNSGHWTIEGSATSQFAQHLRCVAGWPLGATDMVGAGWRMDNLLGDELEGWQAVAARPGARLHLYGKREARAGRKLGHVTQPLDRPSAS